MEGRTLRLKAKSFLRLSCMYRTPIWVQNKMKMLPFWSTNIQQHKYIQCACWKSLSQRKFKWTLYRRSTDLHTPEDTTFIIREFHKYLKSSRLHFCNGQYEPGKIKGPLKPKIKTFFAVIWLRMIEEGIPPEFCYIQCFPFSQYLLCCIIKYRFIDELACWCYPILVIFATK